MTFTLSTGQKAAASTACAILLAFAAPCASKPVDLVEERSIAALDDDLASGRTSSRALVAAYLARIARIDKAGPRIISPAMTRTDQAASL